MDATTAMAFAGEAFERLHPRDGWPEWLRSCTVVSWTRDGEGRFLVSFSVSYKEPLGPNECWEKIGEKWNVVEVNPETSERLVVFKTPKRVETYFEALVDPKTGRTTVLTDQDISALNGDQLNRGAGP